MSTGTDNPRQLGRVHVLIMLCCTLAALALLAVLYWFALGAIVKSIPQTWQIVALCLYPVAIVGTYGLLRLTAFRKFLFRLPDRLGGV